MSISDRQVIDHRILFYRDAIDQLTSNGEFDKADRVAVKLEALRQLTGTIDFLNTVSKQGEQPAGEK